MTRMEYLAMVRKAIAKRDGKLLTVAEYEKLLSQTKSPREKVRR